MGGRFGEEDRWLSFARLDRFAEHGGRYVDTAHSYAEGRSEAVIGEWIRTHPETLRVITKIGHPDAAGNLDTSPQRLRAQVDESCRRLNKVQLDILLLHRDDRARSVAELADSLLDCVHSGAARQIGVSNWASDRLSELVPLLATEGHRPVVSYQFSLAEPSRPLWPGTHDVREAASIIADHDLTLLGWAAQSRGFFAGNTETVDGEGPNPFDNPVNRARRERCRQLAERLDCRPETVALAWVLGASTAYPIVGPRSLTELDISLEAMALDLDEATLIWLRHGTEV